MTGLSVVSWNVNSFNPGRRGEKRELLRMLEWDLALLQEVGRSTFECLAEDFAAVSALDLHGAGGRGHGVAILARERVTLGPGVLVPVGEGQPEVEVWASPERAMAAPAIVDAMELTAFSWHAPHAVGGGNREKKMRAYRSVRQWLKEQPGSLIIGADVNSWTDPYDLHAPDPAAPHFEEHRFLLADPDHGLVDAWRLYLEGHSDERDRSRRLRPDGPLAVTYDRGDRTTQRCAAWTGSSCRPASRSVRWSTCTPKHSR